MENEPVINSAETGLGFILVVGFVIISGIVGGLVLFSIF